MPFIRLVLVVAALAASKRAGGGLEDVPTIAESGFAGYDLTTGGASSRRPARRTTFWKRSAAIRRWRCALRTSVERFASLSVEPGGGSRAEFADYVRAEIAKYDRIVKQLGIRGD